MSKFVKIGVRGGFRALALIAAFALLTIDDPQVIPATAILRDIGPRALALVLIGVIVDLALRADRAPWRFATVHDLLAIVRSTILTMTVFLIGIALIDRPSPITWQVMFMTGVLDLAFLTSAIVLRRAAYENAFGAILGPLALRAQSDRPKLLMLGSLATADRFLRDLTRDPQASENPVGLLTTDPHAGVSHLHGVRVTSFDKASTTLTSFAAQGGERALVFLDDSIRPQDLDGEVLGALRASGVRLLRRTRVSELKSVSGSQRLREINIEELLARPPVALDEQHVRALISGRRVLVTGAGGSIGSELCRQIAALGCAHLSMLDSSEFSLFNIDMEVGSRYPTISRRAIICDVRDAARLHTWFETEEPDIVFHAAALKHVPLMEAHPCESVLTNVIGTMNVCQAVARASVRHMVFISTDKAVDPGNVMGASKRLAEAVVRSQRKLAPHVRYSVVRFGNVLGSAGSVVPTFIQQIERGGPVTVTHQDVERYFMTIPEAVQLVLHASATSSGRESPELGVYVLDMGEPVKIIELARRVIELMGKVPDRDIEIVITGLRPGEKLTEELVDSTEEARSCHPGVLEVVDRVPTDLDAPIVAGLRSVALEGDNKKMREALFGELRRLRMGTPTLKAISG
ncbi:UDP-N-acetylglucosamine 4,6-dehydratase family protein [Brevundimonas sp.]|uniref:UDP-N-acetylglucosamine 4,6-dehydratase family protein n=1 Tax=Brevundimonas sp. TaxID=1871086 RepID=UPI0035B0B7C8